MKIDIRVQGIDAHQRVREHALQRVHSRFTRFGAEVHGVTAIFTDVNGPKGGVDIRCLVRVRGPRLGTITLESRRYDPYVAIADVLERTQRAVRRQLERRRERQTVAHRLRVSSQP
jgi:ribosome-associated translation inhibitor RaiA